MRSNRVPPCLVAACVAGAIASVLSADDDVAGVPPARGGAAVEAEAVAVAAAPGGAGAAAAQAPVAPPDVLHPQVNMSRFTREYRPVPIDATAADVAVRAALDRPIEGRLEFHAASPREVANRFAEAMRVPVVLDEGALADAGIDADDGIVTVRLSDMSFRAALRVVLVPFGLDWMAADEVLTMTTHDRATENLVVVAYPLPRGFGDGRPADFQLMIDLIQSTVAVDSWDCVGGPGSIKPLDAAGGDLLVVSQTCDVHDAVERLLRALHGRALVEFAAGRPVLKVHAVADDRARGELVARLKEICNATLGGDADPDAEVEAVAGAIAVRSSSPNFHALATQVVAAVVGVEERMMPQPQPDNPFGQ